MNNLEYQLKTVREAGERFIMIATDGVFSMGGYYCLFENTLYWREGLKALGFTLNPGEHPIIPILLGEAKLAQDVASDLYEKGVYVSGFCFPVVPKGAARIRTQMSADLTRGDLDTALAAFEEVGRARGVLA